MRAGEYAFGMRHGAWTGKTKEGSPSWHSVYAYGLREGADTSWWDSGTKRAEGLFRMGLRTGDWSDWSKEGAKQATTHYGPWPTTGSATFFPPALIQGRIRKTVARLRLLEQVHVIEDTFTGMVAAMAGDGVAVDRIAGGVEQTRILG